MNSKKLHQNIHIENNRSLFNDTDLNNENGEIQKLFLVVIDLEKSNFLKI